MFPDRQPRPRKEEEPRPVDPEQDAPAPGKERLNEDDERQAREEAGLPEARSARRPPERPVKPGDLPRGREEERRGHALPNTPSRDADDPVSGGPIGRDEQELHGINDK